MILNNFYFTVNTDQENELALDISGDLNIKQVLEFNYPDLLDWLDFTLKTYIPQKLYLYKNKYDKKKYKLSCLYNKKHQKKDHWPIRTEYEFFDEITMMYLDIIYDILKKYKYYNHTIQWVNSLIIDIKRPKKLLKNMLQKHRVAIIEDKTNLDFVVDIIFDNENNKKTIIVGKNTLLYLNKKVRLYDFESKLYDKILSKSEKKYLMK